MISELIELDAVESDEGIIPPVRANVDDAANVFIFQEGAGEVLISREHAKCFADWLHDVTRES